MFLVEEGNCSTYNSLMVLIALRSLVHFSAIDRCKREGERCIMEIGACREKLLQCHTPYPAHMAHGWVVIRPRRSCLSPSQSDCTPRSGQHKSSHSPFYCYISIHCRERDAHLLGEHNLTCMHLVGTHAACFRLLHRRSFPRFILSQSRPGSQASDVTLAGKRPTMPNAFLFVGSV